MNDKDLFDRLNNLLRTFFQANAIADNIAYSLDTELTCHQASKYYHEYFAHVFTSDTFADKLSQVMIDNGVRPVRMALTAEDQIFNSIEDAFRYNYEMMDRMKKQVFELLEFLDYDIRYKVFAVEIENILLSVAKYYRVAEIWYEKAKQYGEDWKKFDKDFDDFVELD